MPDLHARYDSTGVTSARTRLRSAPRRASRTLPFVMTIVLVAIAGPSLAFAQTTASSFGLIGDVAALTTYQTYEPEDEEPRLRSERTFAADGTMTSYSFYSYSFRDGSLNYRSQSEIDADGRLLSSENVAPDGTIVGRTVNEYDGEGRRIRSTTYDEEGTETRRTEWTFDGSGNLIVRETYRNGELDNRDAYSYDGEGRRVAAVETDEEGRITSETTYTVPDEAYEVVEYEDDGSVEETTKVVVRDGRTVSAETYAPDGTLENATYLEYDENGLLVLRRDVYTYESMGNVQTEESSTVYEYAFDEVGNWVRRVAMEDMGGGATPIELEVREITYR